MQHSIPVSHSKVDFCGMQKQKGKLVFNYGSFCPPYHKDKMLLMSINWPVAKSMYEIHVINISESAENRIMDFSKHFPRARSVP